MTNSALLVFGIPMLAAAGVRVFAWNHRDQNMRESVRGFVLLLAVSGSAMITFAVYPLAAMFVAALVVGIWAAFYFRGTKS